jgi:hypothetical protein
MNMRIVASVVMAGVIGVAAPAGELDARTDSARGLLTGNVRVDLFGQRDLSAGPRLQGEGEARGAAAEKSPWLAAGLSLVLPGSGEFYAESYVKSAVFLAIEIAAWSLAYTYDKKGDEQTDFFEAFADEHWSVVRYGQYTEDNLDPPRPPYNWLLPGTEGLAPWDRVDWNELNRMEREIGGYYSHSLPRRPEQQYYELIGKYTQYNQGWDDADPTLPPDYEVMKANLTANFKYYSAERGKANDYYSTAKTFVTIAVVNHIVSAIDAAWSAASYNKKIHLQGSVHSYPVGGSMAVVPALGARYDL